ncbi:hypothetical protein CEXT_63421 [Caerostris extrusa]|uniref:Ribosomal protein S18 n=1 Tax=Caerostris extrusa TaxID=172846 RepID=A0AAV4QLL2_CAEEX|nr:hypothetical protein CEXT_63421 [Caerostris extrusa]
MSLQKFLKYCFGISLFPFQEGGRRTFKRDKLELRPISTNTQKLKSPFDLFQKVFQNSPDSTLPRQILQVKHQYKKKKKSNLFDFRGRTAVDKINKWNDFVNFGSMPQPFIFLLHQRKRETLT